MEVIAYRPADAAKVIGISRSQLYLLLRDGSIRYVKCGASTLIPADALRAWVERLAADQGEPAR